MSTKPYGFLVTYESSKSMMRTLCPDDVPSERHSFRSKGSEAKATKRAKGKKHFSRIVSVEPFTEEQWLQTFGEGRM